MFMAVSQWAPLPQNDGQRQRYVASWALPSRVDETSSAILLDDWQCCCAIAAAAVLSAASADQRNVIASGE
jgi:hypothetical protein